MVVTQILHRQMARCVTLVALVLACVGIGDGGPTSVHANGATSNSLVGANVLSATSLSVTGCLPGVAGRTDFGSVAGGTSNVTSSDCTLSFGSSNDTAALRVAQLDGTGAAMSAVPDRPQSSFGTNGISTLASGVAGMNANGATSSIMQPDGKLVGVGSTFLAGQVQSIVYRRNTDGTLDTAGFNAPNGFVAFDTTAGQNESLRGVDLQPDGKIVVVGWTRTGGTDYDGVIARVGADGMLDTGFGGGGTGWRVVDLGGPNSGESYADVSVEASGTIVAAGNDDLAGIDDRWVLDRFTGAGIPDALTGAGSGRIVVNPSINQDRVASIAPHPGGGFLVGGQSQPGSLVGHVLRVDTSLNQVTSWGASGHRQIDIVSFYETVIEIEVLADGSAVLAITQSGGVSNHAIVAKLTPGGSLDVTGFAVPNGFVELPSVGDADQTSAIEIALNGDIYVAFNESAASTKVGRLTRSGIVDTSFGAGGVTSAISVRNPGTRSLHLLGGSLVLAASNAATINDSMVRLGGPEVDDYLNLGGGSDRDWSSGATTSMFGVCLRALAGSSPDWAVDGDADCTAADGDPWRAIPSTTAAPGSKVAHTTVGGAASTAALRFGFRPSTTLPAGRYETPLLFEVTAPG